MKEEKGITSIENNKSCWNERYCYVSESRWDVQHFEKCIRHCLAYSHINLSLIETSLNKWMHFQHVLASRELQQTAYMLYVRWMAEKFLSTLLLMFIASCYFIYNARRDTAAEKEFDIAIQMSLEHVLVQRFKKKEMDEKNNF